MKKTFKSMFVLLLVLGLVAVVFVPVFASSTMRDPVVTPLKVTDTYTSEVVGVGYLKGAVQLENQLMAPVGRTDEQFGSNGLVLSDLTGKEKVKACFFFPGYNSKWAGNIFKWNGTKWVKQTTTFTNDPAGTPTACASGLGNGTYALIIYYWGPQEISYPAEPL
jgi:hypothetical protein